MVFDWGGTLSEFVSAELVDAWRLAARHLSPDREEELAGRLVAVEDAFWASTATDQRSGTLAELLGAATAELGLDVAEALLEEAAVRHLDAWTPHIRHDPEAAPTLKGLRRGGVRVGLLSNTHWPRHFHERFLERDGLVELIDARLYTSEMPYQKPHPSAFLSACEALGTEPGHAVFVGDRPWDDVTGARRAGMRAVLRPNPLVPPVAGAEAPDATIDRLPELLEVLDAWQA